MKTIKSEESIKQIRERHAKEIEDFQENCSHSNISDWMEYHWAPGHYSHHVKICNRCQKIMDEKYPQFVTEEK